MFKQKAQRDSFKITLATLQGNARQSDEAIEIWSLRQVVIYKKNA
jgi:hypothetical protein